MGSSVGAGRAAPAPDAEARFTDETGAVHGVVFDEELRPIPNATVGLRPGGSDASTAAASETGFERQVVADSAGAFAFSNLSPGTYHVFAVALGFASGTKRVEVVAGKVTETQVLLAQVPSDAPYYETHPAKGMVRSVVWRVGARCQTVVQPPLGTCLGLQFQDVTRRIVLDPDWATVVDEVVWVPNSAVVHQRAYVFATFPNVTDFSGVPDFESPGHFEAGGPSPVVLRIERAVIRERGHPEESQHGNTRFRALNNFDDVNASGVLAFGVMLDQPMSVYITIFHKEVAPAEFSVRPDA